MQDKVLSMIGMATKAGKVQSGEFLTENAVKERKAKLVVVAEDASDNTKKLFKDKCSFYKIPLCIYGTKEDLGKWTGNEYRAALAVVDEGFVKSIVKNLRNSGGCLINEN